MSKKVGAKTKGYIKNLSTSKIQKFQFNPEKFSYSRGATYTEMASPGMSYPEAQFARGNSRVFPLELFFHDKPNSGVIKKYLNFLEEFLPPEENSTKNKAFTKPPEMLLCYGYFIRRCVLENLNVVIEEFDTNGDPVVARLTLQLRQVGL